MVLYLGSVKMKKRIIVIGGSASGPKSAAKARRVDQNAEIILFEKGANLSMASCGYPYYVGDIFSNRNLLIGTALGVRDPGYFLSSKNIDARVNTAVTGINTAKKEIYTKDEISGLTGVERYDSCVICTGSRPNFPPIPGIKLKGITTLQSMKDADYLRSVRDEGLVKRAVVVGGGLIGIETCEALQLAGIHVTVVEMLPQILGFLDPEMAKHVENHIVQKGAHVITGNGVSRFNGEDRLESVTLGDGQVLPCDLAVIAIGVHPNSKLAKDAGIETASNGGIIVNERMETSAPDVYSAGDCVTVKHRITGEYVLSPMGDLANLEGRVAGENAAIESGATFKGTIQTGICKVFDITAGSSGLSERVARDKGYDIETVINVSPDKPGFIGGDLLISKMVISKLSGKLLGYQSIGAGDASKQLATAAMAITANMKVSDLIDLDLPYAPPFSLAIDHFIASAHLMENKLKGRLKGISSEKLKRYIDQGVTPFLLDVRTPDECSEMCLGVGERMIPLGELRERLDELPRDCPIICYCKISLRGYEAALILEANGFSNLSVLEGGLMGWPYGRKK